MGSVGKSDGRAEIVLLEEQLPLSLLCYDLSQLTSRVTGDLCTF